MEEKLLDLLVSLCEDDEVRDNLDEDLFESGLLDSLAFAELLYAIEQNFGVIIAPSEVERTDINTPNKIIQLVKERMER
ncbi:MAG: D-alanine--poly(phosphoribitol) ligase subunit DltC [Roseburia sp.]